MTKPFTVAFAALLALGPFAKMAASQTPESRTPDILNTPAYGVVPPAAPFRLEHVAIALEYVAIAEDAPVLPGLQMTAHPDKNVYKPGESILLYATLANTSSELVPLGGGAFDISQFNLIVRDEKNRILPLSAYGEQVLAIPQNVYWNPMLALNSGQTREYEFPLSRMYDLHKPQTYSLIIKRQITIQKRSDKVDNGFVYVEEQVISNRVLVKVADVVERTGSGRQP